MLARNAALIVLSLALGACASKPAPAPTHRWMLGENVERLPMQGLPARPRAVADPTPPELANFGDEAARNTARAGAMARGALVGAAATTLEAGAHLGPILPLCV